jgi:hypothetical protein
MLFLHKLENKMPHLHETFVWLMTVIDELLEVTGRVNVCQFFR